MTHLPRSRHLRSAGAALMLLPLGLMQPLFGHAQEMAYAAITTEPVNLRAGPSPDYPLVTQVPPQLQVNVTGCTDAYQWCDVILPDGARGWAYGQSVSIINQGQALALSQYGAGIGIPLLVFSVGQYWGTHYRNRPFYNEPRYWSGNPPPRYAGPPEPYYYPQDPSGYGYPQQRYPHQQRYPNPQGYPQQQQQRPGYLGQAPGIVSPSTGIVGGQAPGIVGRTPHTVPSQPPGIIGGPPPSVRPGAPLPSVAPAQPVRPYAPQPVGPPPRFQQGAGPGMVR